MIIGWDIGGAHVKAALLDEAGRVLQVIQEPCPLWKGLSHLEAAIDAIMQQWPHASLQHAVTMTGELVDCFVSREQGVSAIIGTLRNQLNTDKLGIFAGQRFIAADKVTPADTMAIASANWLASAQFAAKRRQQALFVDIGSTTTDILLIEDHTLKALGYSDFERLVSGELLYTGVVRTAVMAIAQRAVFQGREMGLMAEYFATMADVYRLTGDLNPAHDQSDTADGADKSLQASARRLSRMTGYEFTQSDADLWQAFANELKRRQMTMIRQACERQWQRSPQSDMILIGAGVGRFLLNELAVECGWSYLDFNALVEQAPRLGDIDSADCAPAVAVAFLAGGFG